MNVAVALEIDATSPGSRRHGGRSNEPTWNSQVSEPELLTGEPIGRGTHFRTVNSGQTYTATMQLCFTTCH